MRSKLSQFMLVLCLLAVVVPSAIAQQVTFAIPKLIVNTSFLNVRTGPGVQFAVLITVVGGTELPVLGVANDELWYQVNTVAGVGWVNVEFTLARGDFSRVPIVPAPALGDPIVTSNVGLPADQGQGGGALPPTRVGTARFTGVSFEGGDIHVAPSNTSLKIATVVPGQPDVVLPLLGFQIVEGFEWYQMNLEPFGVVWTQRARLRALECGGDTVAVTVEDVLLRFDGFDNRLPITLAEGTEVFLRGVAPNNFFIVEDTNRTLGLIEFEKLRLRPENIISRCDLLPTSSGTQAVPASAGQGGGGGSPSVATAPSVAPSGNVVIVNTPNLNVRSGPGAIFAPIAVVPGGTRLGVAGRTRDGVWLLVVGDFGRGWVNSEFTIFRGVYSTIPIIN